MRSNLGMGWLNSSENVTCVPVPRPLPGARGSGLKMLKKMNDNQNVLNQLCDKSGALYFMMLLESKHISANAESVSQPVSK